MLYIYYLLFIIIIIIFLLFVCLFFFFCHVVTRFIHVSSVRSFIAQSLIVVLCLMDPI